MKINQVWVTEHHIGGTTGRSTGRHLFKLREGHRALPAPVKTCLVPGTSTYLKHFETTNLGMYLLGSMINGFNGFSQGDQQTMIVCNKNTKSPAAARREIWEILCAWKTDGVGIRSGVFINLCWISVLKKKPPRANFHPHFPWIMAYHRYTYSGGDSRIS